MRSKYDEFRMQADECCRMSRLSANDNNRAAWLRLAGEWMRMIPENEAENAEESFCDRVRSQGTHQRDSTASH
jgi:hypothetical protein